MPMLLGTKGSDILRWRASAELVAAVKQKLARHGEQASSGAAQSLLEQFAGSLREELEYEARAREELEVLQEALAGAETPAELLPLRSRYLELATSHFRRRRSVLSLCQLCNDLHDRLFSRALFFAGERLLQLGQGSPPECALFVSGDRGRGEQTMGGENRYFLVHAEPAPRFLLFRRQLAAVLQELGLQGGDQTLWHGSLSDWRDYLDSSFEEEAAGPENFLTALPPFATPQKTALQDLPRGAARLVVLSDLVLVQGESSLAAEALAGAARCLQVERNRESFQQLARRSIGLPVALGRFGRLKLERDGEHRGELNLKDLAQVPLVMALRALTLYAGIQACGTVDRIHRLQEKGALDVELSERLLGAYQEIMQLRIWGELRGEEQGAFCNPEELSDEEAARLRSALEAVLSLQKIGYQRLVGTG